MNEKVKFAVSSNNWSNDHIPQSPLQKCTAVDPVLSKEMLVDWVGSLRKSPRKRFDVPFFLLFFFLLSGVQTWVISSMDNGFLSRVPRPFSGEKNSLSTDDSGTTEWLPAKV